MRKTISYHEAGVESKNKRELSDLIRTIISQHPTPMDRYVIHWRGGFAGLFDFNEFLRDRRYSEKKKSRRSYRK